MEDILNLLKEFEYQEITEKRLSGIIKVLKNNKSDYRKMQNIYDYFVKENSDVLFAKIIKCDIQYEKDGEADMDDTREVFFVSGIILDANKEKSVASLVSYLEHETFFGSETELEGFYKIGSSLLHEIREIRERENNDAFLN